MKATLAAIVFMVASAGLGNAHAETPSRKDIRLALCIADETVLSAFRDAAREYEAMHPDVKVTIQAVPERSYAQWVNTLSIGKMLPDIVQAQSIYGIWASLAAEYFQPLGGTAGEPNPYNQGTELEGVAWRSTFRDDMTAGYWPHLTEIYSVPVNFETRRLFYNKELLNKLGGVEVPPSSLNEWEKVCERIRERDPHITPLALSREFVPDLLQKIYRPLAHDRGVDLDHSFWEDWRPEVTLRRLKSGEWSFQSSPSREAFAAMRQIGRQAQQGFATTEASQARFLFLSGQAVMTFGSARDAAVYYQQSAFPVGVCDMPRPALADQDVTAPVLNEAASGSVHFMVSRQSANVEQAVDFLKFLTSKKENEALTQSMGWYPVIKGTKVKPEVEAFAPQLKGVSGRSPAVAVAPSLQLWFDQEFARMLEGEISMDQFLAALDHQWLANGGADIRRRDRIFHDAVIRSEFNSSRRRANLIFSPEKTSDEMRKLALESLVLLRFGMAARKEILAHGND